jgi:hypothetical protein
VVTVGRLVKKNKNRKEKLLWGDRRFRSRHMVIIMTQRGKTLGYNLLTTYHMPPGEKYAKVSFYELAKWMDG